MESRPTYDVSAATELAASEFPWSCVAGEGEVAFGLLGKAFRAKLEGHAEQTPINITITDPGCAAGATVDPAEEEETIVTVWCDAVCSDHPGIEDWTSHPDGTSLTVHLAPLQLLRTFTGMQVIEPTVGPVSGPEGTASKDEGSDDGSKEEEGTQAGPPEVV